MPLRIANGAGFLGDDLAAPRRLVESATVDYLTLEYLAELTMSILARAREKDPAAGYAADFLEVLESLLGPIQQQRQLKLVTNAGGMNPAACAVATAQRLVAAGLGDLVIGVVSGDDILPRLEALRAAGHISRMPDEVSCPWPTEPFVSANVYLGAAPIADALGQGARMVITGRGADASLTVGPAMHEFETRWDDWQRLAAYSVAGHLIECGAQVTGGYATDWQSYDVDNIGYPIAEMEADGTTVITKPAGSGGSVNRRTVVEQLTYEIGDPQHYLTPDVDVDFTTVAVEDLGQDRVRMTGATGRPATDTYKLSAAYRDGFMAAGELLVYGDDAGAKALRCAEIIFARLEASGISLARTKVELLGAGEAAGRPGSTNAKELVLRIAAHDPDRAAIERFTKEFAPLITSGPAGLAGYAAGRPTVRPVFAYVPLLVARSQISPAVEVRAAREWATQ